MDIGFVYTGERRFENIGKENHKLLFNSLSEFTAFNIYDECKDDRSNDDFTISAPNQIWDFYKALPKVKEQIVIRMRTDIWFSKSSIPHVINEILATQQGHRNFTLIGAELDSHYNKEYTTYDLPEVKKQKRKTKTADFMTIVNRDVLKPKEDIYKWLKTEKSKSGNRLWQKIRYGEGKYSFGQIYLIRHNYREENLTDEYLGLQFARGYGPKTAVAQKYYYEHLSSNNS
jgi:hypothetical protein